MTLEIAQLRSMLVGSAVALSLTVLAPAIALGASSDPQLLVTQELRDGDIEYQVEADTLYFFDEEKSPFAVQVIDGCALNGNLWVFGAGLSGAPVPLVVMDFNTGKDERIVLPPFEPGQPIGTVLEPEALPLCDDAPIGGLPALEASAVFTSANARGQDATGVLELRSDGRDDAYRRIIRDGTSLPVITRRSPIAVIDDSTDLDQLYLLAEGRTPRQIEGVVFTGAQGMLPARASLDKALRSVSNGNVRRAFETAKSRRVPQGIIEALGLKKVERVHHVSLDFGTLGADAYLAKAGWIKERGAPIELPKLVEERFTVEVLRADGTSTPVPLSGPFLGSDAEGQRWEFTSDEALVQIIDACELSGSFWTVAGVITDEPVEVVVTDTHTGTSLPLLVWTDRRDVSRLADTSSLATCP